jgi:hypothetical protein
MMQRIFMPTLRGSAQYMSRGTGAQEVGYGEKQKTKLHGLSPRSNYTDRAKAACRRSDCQLLRTEGATWSA